MYNQESVLHDQVINEIRQEICALDKYAFENMKKCVEYWDSGEHIIDNDNVSMADRAYIRRIVDIYQHLIHFCKDRGVWAEDVNRYIKRELDDKGVIYDTDHF